MIDSNQVTGSVSKEKDNSGRWRVEFRVKNGKGDGRPLKSLKRGFKTKREAQAYLDELKTEWIEKSAKLNDPKHNMTFEELLEQYISTTDVATKISTHDTRNNMINRHILPYFGKMKLADISQVTVEKWRGSFYKNGALCYKESYIHALRSRLSAILNFGVERHYMDFNPAKHVKMGVKEAPERPVWTVDQYKVFRDTMTEDEMYYYVFEVLFWCGLRRGELLALTLGDIDLKNRIINVNKTLYEKSGERIIQTPKTPKSTRKVTMSEGLTEELKTYISKLPETDPASFLFPVSKYAVDRALHKGIEKSGLPPITIHCFRHSHITYLVNNGWSAPVISARVGHESIYITTHYMHCYSEMDDAMCEMMDKDMK